MVIVRGFDCLNTITLISITLISSFGQVVIAAWCVMPGKMYYRN